MSTESQHPQSTSPLASTAMEAAREITPRASLTAPYQFLHDAAYEAAAKRTAAIIQKHFQPLLAKVEGERDALDRAVTLNRNNWRIDSEEKDAVITALRADLAAKEADSARLDWLLAQNGSFIICDDSDDSNGAIEIEATREAIDAARSALASRADKGGAT